MRNFQCKLLPPKPKTVLGYVCAQAKTEAVFVEKDGCVDSVILSVEQFRVMQAREVSAAMNAVISDF